jgi:hypothetical protein
MSRIWFTTEIQKELWEKYHLWQCHECNRFVDIQLIKYNPLLFSQDGFEHINCPMRKVTPPKISFFGRLKRLMLGYFI